MIMPGRNGIELANIERTTYPSCSVLLFSGNASSQGLLDTSDEDSRTFEILEKPVFPPELLKKVASLLNLRANKV